MKEVSTLKKTTKNRLIAPLIIHFEGPLVKKHRIPLPELVSFLQNLQSGIERVALLITGALTSERSGRKPGDITQQCTLDIIEVGKGSITVTCDLAQSDQYEKFDNIGERSVTAFLKGITAIGKDTEALPSGYDRGVFKSLYDSGRVFSHGIQSVSFDFKTRIQHIKVKYTEEKYHFLEALLRATSENVRTLEGRLLMGDFKESGLRCRLHPPVGNPINCEFDELLKKEIYRALIRYVRISGVSSEEEGIIRKFLIKNLEILPFDEQPILADSGKNSFYETSVTIEQLAEKQKVSPVTDFNGLLGTFWPDGESVDEFLATVRHWRTEHYKENAD